MTEIIAAHLERVARLNEILDEIAAGRGPFKVDNWDFACSVIENSKALAKEAKELLAAALAACAREEAKPLREALTWAIGVIEAEYGKDGPRLEQEEFLRAKAALERAVGEKA